MSNLNQNRIHYEPSPRWVRVKFGGETIADSKKVLLAWDGGYFAEYYFPREDVQMDLLITTADSGNGRAAWHVKAGGQTAENGAWSHLMPKGGLEGIKDYIAFRWHKMDRWYEEDEEVFVHVRDPYHRVDTVPSSRHIRVEVGGVTVAESKRPILLFETTLPTRYYLPAEDIQMELLSPTNTQTRCPYKGIASYWSVKVGENVHKDIVWGYPDPIPEIPKIKDLFSFYNEKVDIYVDGELEERPQTEWS